MKIVNIHEAKTHLSQLIQGALEGEPFIIAKAGKPLVRVTALAAEENARRRIGFLDGKIEVPDDFDRMGEREIVCMFGTEG